MDRGKVLLKTLRSDCGRLVFQGNLLHRDPLDRPQWRVLLLNRRAPPNFRVQYPSASRRLTTLIDRGKHPAPVEEEDDDPFGDEHVIETPHLSTDKKGWLEM